jgi:hypothetical protein
VPFRATARNRPRVRWRREIIAAQVREIGEMEQLITDLEQNPIPSDAPGLPPAK